MLNITIVTTEHNHVSEDAVDNSYKYSQLENVNMADNKDTQVKDLEQKLKTLFQGMQRMEKLLKRTEAKASRAMDMARKTQFELSTLKRTLKQREY